MGQEGRWHILSDSDRPKPPPSPGAAWKKAKLTDQDRKRITEEQAQKRKGRPSKPERVGIKHRFTRGDVEMAILEDGHYHVFRAGDFAPGAIVTAREGYLRARIGKVRSLIVTYGDGIGVVVKWQHLETDKRRPGAVWDRDSLEVLRKAR